MNVATYTYGLAGLSEQFRVYIDGSLTAIDNVDTPASNKLVFQFTGDKRYKGISVYYAPSYTSDKRMKDLANNDLGQTNVNATWK